jgi:hypothetical protein
MTVENTNRTLEQLVVDFKASEGNFTAFNEGMNEEEKVIFKDWLAEMRAPTV